MEHSETLVEKQTIKLHGFPEGADVRLQQSLDALGEIAEVEDVVRLRWRRQKVLGNPLVDFHGGVYDTVRCVPHGRSEVR